MGYAQFGEEEIIIEYFSRYPAEYRRRVLDIGAHDGVSCSNSKRLIELGWEATLVEPSPLAFTKLVQVHANSPNVRLVNVGIVTGATRMLTFFESGGLFVGTFDENHRDEWEGKQHVHFKPIYVIGCSFDTLFETLPGPYDFISIDVEGTNVELFKTLCEDLDDGTDLICVEHQGRVSEIVSFAEEYGYCQHAVTEANILLARA